MSGKDSGVCVFLGGAAVVLLGSVVYGLLTGEISTMGGEGRYDSDLLWQSREREPRYFWFAVGFHFVLGSGAAWLGVRLARDDE